MTSAGRSPRATDVLVALGTGVAALAALLAGPAVVSPSGDVQLGDPVWWATAITLGLQALAITAAGVAPQIVLLGTALLAALLGLLFPSGFANIADAAVLVAVLRATLLVPVPRLRVLLPLTGVLVAIGQTADAVGAQQLPLAAGAGVGVLQAVVIVGLPAVGVLAVTARREARQARSNELAAVEREQDALVRAAVADERTVMARELHDIAAHHVSSIALMSAAIERQIDTDPAQAKQAVRRVRAQSRALLDDLRRLVGLLREDAADPEAVETLATIPALVAGAVDSGRSVDLRIVGDGDGVGPLGQLVAYRMVQEALANAARHAPGARCTVELDGRPPERFVATVRNEPAPASGPSSAPGFGLIGMRERAALVGGTLAAGRDADGGWTVRLELPSERAEQRRGDGADSRAGDAARETR